MEGSNPTAFTHGHFVLSPVLLALKDQDGCPSNSTIDIDKSHGKIGDCEQSKLTAVQKRVPLNMRLRTLLILWKVFNQLLSEDTMKRAWEHVFQGLIWVQFQLGKSICSQIWKAINDFCRNIQLIMLNLT